VQTNSTVLKHMKAVASVRIMTARLGLDIGSTTVKLVLLDGADIMFETYRRHNADIAGELARLVDDVAGRFPDHHFSGAVTGSGGLSVATALGLPFVQEVIAETAAITRFHPETDVIIELGGEDAKITYLHPVLEQRMNGTCAGGTGAFIDQMAVLLQTDAAGLDELASHHTTLYPIASRCGVFAKSDLQPLINEGAAPEDLAASVFAAVVSQTISGLACGRPIRGTVAFLGGPLHFLPQLRAAFERALSAQVDTCHTPEGAQLYVALGAALLADSEPVSLATLHERVRRRSHVQAETHRLPALFSSPEEYAGFRTRHARAVIPRRAIEHATGPCFLGIDAGSTTIKATLIDDTERILFTHYGSNGGDPVGGAVEILAAARRALPATATIARTCVTGYGESLVQAALRAEDGEIETMAHCRAAQFLCPDVTAIIDIGGQDMKYLRLRGGAVDSISVNEACSSGCGSFLETFATTMDTHIGDFAAAALTAVAPVDLGSRCTVFMNSAVKQAQKEGAGVGEISAGLSYSVVRNALYKVVKIKDADELGGRVVVQGGTFLNDAVLRAFELLTGREVVRPDIAGLMGAFGAARIARERFHEQAPATPSRLLGPAEIDRFRVTTTKDTCRLCQNACQRTISTFPAGDRHVSGNRCDRGGDLEARGRRPKSSLPNLVEEKYRRVFGYRRLTEDKAYRGDIGIPRVLNMYENYPFWFTALTSLGFRVLLSGRSSHELFEAGMDTIPSENVCYPAKLVHGHIAHLLAKGVRTIFYPCIAYEQQATPGADNHFNCPVVMSYPEVINANVEGVRENGVRFLMPFLNLADRDVLVNRLVEVFADWRVTREEAAIAVDAAYAEDARVKADIAEMGRAALRFMEETGTPGIVLAGRPYHLDPEVHHGIPDLVNSLGLAVLTEDAVVEPGLLQRPLRVRDQWAYHSRLYDAAAAVATRPDLELVQLNSFGCGVDAITGDQVAEILQAAGRSYTTLKIDEVSNLGAARIRLRSLTAATRERRRADDAGRTGADGPGAAGEAPAHPARRVEFTKQMRSRHTILMPQMAPLQFSLFEAALQRSGYDVRLLREVSHGAIETGLRHVNNDACYPAIVVIGQLLDALRSGEFDTANCTVLMSQTGGVCRATNYAALLRKGLRDSGFGHVPVLTLSVGGVEKHEGFTLTPAVLHRVIRAAVLGDTLQTVLLRVRPYETEPGAAVRLAQRWDTICREFLREDGWSATLDRRIGYAELLRLLVREFDSLPLMPGERRPRVGIVGEILVKFHPDANNHAVDVIEREGCEAVIPGLLGFVLNGAATAEWRWRTLGVGRHSRHMSRVLVRLLERYQEPASRALRAAGGKFDVPLPIAELVAKVEGVVQLGNNAGEGWYLTAEMIAMIEEGTPNIICAQPFACLPNHITGKGMFRELRRRYPNANIVGIDYDPGASEVNQLNRIKLMLSTALSRRDAPRRETLQPDGSRVLV